MYNVPVLYIVFNRLDTVEQTFKAIKNIKPKEFYIASDAARPDKTGEKEKVEQVRNYILQNIDWECNVHTLFREENLGCKYGPAKAIKWFFENVEYGIVLEDDILATESFFKYCKLMLDKYKNSNDIGFISGCTVEDYVTEKQNDYFLTTVIDGWGWASWKKLIKDFNPDTASLLTKKIKNVNSILIDKKAEKQLMRLSLISAKNQADAWDYQMADFMAVNGRYTVLPVKPLVRNLGFSLDSTHTAIAPSWYKDVSYEYDVKLCDKPLVDVEYTKAYEAELFDKRPLYKRIISKVIPYKVKKWIKGIIKR